jgi:hypothetical protein
VEAHELRAGHPEGWLERLYGELTPAGLPLNASTNGAANALLVKSGAGTLFGFSALNTGVPAAFVHLFDTGQQPVNGTVPMFAFPIAGTPGFITPSFGVYGRAFRSGIFLAVSTTAAALTLATAVFLLDAQYV